MTENRFAHSPALRHEAATDEPAFAETYRPRPGDPAYDPASDFEFATEAESDAYFAGLCDGIRQGGGVVTPRLEARARAAYPELFGEPAPAESGDLLDFDPAPLRYRSDGLTPEKQREYVEALADCGVARVAAARIGVSEQAINRVRRRADARSFDLACEAAMRFGARRLRAIAFERAIEGTVKRHYWHGELKSEERVYDNRLLVYLLGRTAHLLDEPDDAKAVADQWEPWVEAIGAGTPPPVPSAPAPAEAGAEAPAPDPDDIDEDDAEVWQRDGVWWTCLLPPDGFTGVEEGRHGEFGYRRRLTDDEEAIMEAHAARLSAIGTAYAAHRRDTYFADISQAFAAFGPLPDFSPREAETSETSGGDRA
ncbi:hypothetical protein RCO27_09140 [Sphingosinicella sp. LHD-64]|uniref:hypothetical protein n=1 Tax=Sphingosinicella sp. LHD-64 TaxID=3072139 RepID=UPI00280F3CAF|nr:hypothetical protein [Sphingosinicella sp. LHD-64]MDQ8756394.1 hypothetical protein [Sphingosinicella sp. LHD-64]